IWKIFFNVIDKFLCPDSNRYNNNGNNKHGSSSWNKQSSIMNKDFKRYFSTKKSPKELLTNTILIYAPY
ncbi:hypothetical protein L9F63_026496, partial [Diploptera punctata]